MNNQQIMKKRQIKNKQIQPSLDTQNRRDFMLAMLSIGVAPLHLSHSKSAMASTQQLTQQVTQQVSHRHQVSAKKQTTLISAQGKTDDQYGISWIHPKTGKTKTVLTGFRGHGLSIHPLKTNTVVMYSRRPGTQGIEVNLATGQIQHRFKCQSNRHFLGHGCFNESGAQLFTTEADYHSGQGKIVVRDGRTYEPISEMNSYGIGPHDIQLMPDGKTLVVANGGIQTHPNSGRKKLNLKTMASNLTYIDIESGNKIESVSVAESKASIRHLSITEEGSVIVAMQFQREIANHNRTVPLGGIHKPGAAFALFPAPDTVISRMKDYAGSVTYNNKTGIAGFTSPKGNIAVFWNVHTLEFVGHHSLQDVCGLVVSKNQRYFLLSNSFGEIRHIHATTLIEDKSKRLQSPKLSWDNHMVVVNT
ncbi:MAG: DUF1513 domain-containing protein [Pseudomonadales bacterium]|nr:DUF1513 domain-containing protein [Pseudomonadales bacterium]